ncbi:hypothetical protein N7532_011561 [Penicillium argentinense]|uniref:Uncharacterized protein n=1 Tax=Penicillium argentinense TaxID=1131581 RepID=A0A9W9EIM2_9EURO|nr:uncharacterized protein N7532_011561 [Penicillium argentinense]KAJ5082518.1 hypothetical protein N7532_011561 [Penicillium argentinense]
MNPYLSWAILLVVAGGLGWYYTNGSAPKVKPVVQSTVEKAQPAPKKPKRKTKAPEAASVKKTEVKTVVSPPTTEDEKPDEDIDRKEMARRLAAMKNGTSQAAAPTSKSQKKKAKKANKLEGGSHASSTTGAEADDDLSPAVSPQVNATVPSAGYVSDMLEAPAPGASVLRVTGNVEPEPKKEKPQPFKPAETKKQRQHRQKREAEKLQAREDEKLRVQMEAKQRKGAQQAREAAESKVPAAPTNAWKQATNGASKPTSSPAPRPAPVQLLDTFEATPASNSWTQDLPSEQEQERLAKEEGAWTQVGKHNKKGANKKAGKAEESVSEASASESKPAPAAPAPVEPRVTIKQTHIQGILDSTVKGHPLDSDWAA